MVKDTPRSSTVQTGGVEGTGDPGGEGLPALCRLPAGTSLGVDSSGRCHGRRRMTRTLRGYLMRVILLILLLWAAPPLLRAQTGPYTDLISDWQRNRTTVLA